MQFLICVLNNDKLTWEENAVTRVKESHFLFWCHDLLFHRRKLPHARVNCAKFSIRNFGCRWILAEEGTPGPMQDAGRTVQPLGKCCIERGSGGLACTLQEPAIDTCATHSTLSTLERDTARVPRRTGTSAAAPLRTSPGVPDGASR